MADLQSEQEYLMGRWRQSGMTGDDYLKKTREGQRLSQFGYEFDPENGTISHPLADLAANVDPNSISSPALRNHVTALQKQQQLTQSSATPSPSSSPGVSPNGGRISFGNGLTSETTWRNTFGPKPQQPTIVFDPVKDRKTWQEDTAIYNKNMGNEVFRAPPAGTGYDLPTGAPDITKYKPGYQPPGAPKGDAPLSEDEKKKMIQQGVLRYRDNVLELNPNFNYGR